MKGARGHRSGFTLLEVLVATTLMAVAVGTLMTALTTSVANATRLTESDRAAVMGKRVLDQLMIEPLPVNQEIAGEFNPRETGMKGGWRARLETFEVLPTLPREPLGRLVVEVWWMSGAARRTFLIEGYRKIPVGAP